MDQKVIPVELAKAESKVKQRAQQRHQGHPGCIFNFRKPQLISQRNGSSCVYCKSFIGKDFISQDPEFLMVQYKGIP